MDKLISLLYEDSSLSAEELSAMLGESEESIEKRIAEYKKNKMNLKLIYLILRTLVAFSLLFLSFARLALSGCSRPRVFTL